VIEDVLEHLVGGIVDNPDHVEVRTRTMRRGGQRSGSLVEVRVHPDDLGRVIGRGGRTASALRTVVDALAGRKVRVDFVDTVTGR
jgi:predicted RNA-binding protein YlqC (UPF0109 family)